MQGVNESQTNLPPAALPLYRYRMGGRDRPWLAFACMHPVCILERRCGKGVTDFSTHCHMPRHACVRSDFFKGRVGQSESKGWWAVVVALMLFKVLPQVLARLAEGKGILRILPYTYMCAFLTCERVGVRHDSMCCGWRMHVMMPGGI
jgi:hypothetical protein